MESLIDYCADERADFGRVLYFKLQLQYSLEFHSKKKKSASMNPLRHR